MMFRVGEDIRMDGQRSLSFLKAPIDGTIDEAVSLSLLGQRV